MTMDDPRLDKIFEIAYRKTLRQVEREERSKRIDDRIEAFVSMFECELAGRDLTAEQRAQFVEAFRRRIVSAEKEREHRIRLRKRKMMMIGSGVGVAAVLAFLIYAGSVHPFRSVSSIENELQTYMERVEAGSYGFAKRYFKTLDKYDRRLGNDTVDEYEGTMRNLLEDSFNRLVTALQNGDISLYDDAKDLADLFPEPEERKAKRDQLSNARSKMVGNAINKGIEDVKGFLEPIVQPIVEKAKEAIEGIGESR